MQNTTMHCSSNKSLQWNMFAFYLNHFLFYYDSIQFITTGVSILNWRIGVLITNINQYGPRTWTTQKKLTLPDLINRKMGSSNNLRAVDWLMNDLILIAAIDSGLFGILQFSLLISVKQGLLSWTLKYTSAYQRWIITDS